MATGRYVAIPFEAFRTNKFGLAEQVILIRTEFEPLDFSAYNKYATYAGVSVKWAEVPVEDLEAENIRISWTFNSDVYGYVSFSGTGKQAITFFRSLKNRWLLELVPEDSFLVNV